MVVSIFWDDIMRTKRIISVLLTVIILFGSLSVDAFNVSPKTEALKELTPGLDACDTLFRDFILNKGYLNYNLDAYDIWFDMNIDKVNMPHKFFAYDFDSDGNIELIMSTSVYNHQDFAIFKVEDNRVIMFDDIALYKGGFSHTLKNGKYNGLVGATGVGGYCEFYDVNGSQRFTRIASGQTITCQNDGMDDDLFEILRNESTDGTGVHFVSDVVKPILWYTVDEIEALGWNEFFHPSWSRAYYDYLFAGDYTEYFISGDNLSASGNDPQGSRFGLKDMNRDGIPELLIADPWGSGTYGHGYIFTYKNGTVKYAGWSDSYGGQWNPHMTSDKNYPGIYTYMWNRGEYSASNEMVFHILYTEFDGTGTTVVDVCSDKTTSGKYGRLTDDVDLYYAVINSESVDYNLTYLPNISVDFETDEWEDFIVRYGDFFGKNEEDTDGELPEFYYTNGSERGTHDFKYYNVEKYINESPSTEYDPRMAAFAAAMANAAGSEDNLKKTFAELGIADNDIKTFHYGGYSLFETMSTAFSIAHKKLSDGRYLIYVTLRGTRDPSQGIGEWMDNIACSMNPFSDGTGPHDGFQRCCDDAYDELEEYEKAIGTNSSNCVYVITGHSRGAAAANLLSVKLMDKRNISKSSLYCYTIACPDVAALYCDDWSNIERTNKYNNIFNVNNVKDPVPYLPGKAGDLLNNAWNTFPKIFEGKSDLVRWDKYGTSMWYSWDWSDDSQVSIDLRLNGDNVHNQYEYWRYLSELKTDYKDRNSTQALASGLSELLCNILIVRCPADVVITDKNGNKAASVIGEETNYYNSDVGEIIIFTNGDRKAIFINDPDSYNVKLTGTDKGEMDFDIIKANPFTGEYSESDCASFRNVSLEAGKTMVSSVNPDGNLKDMALYTVDEQNNTTAEILPDGTERILSLGDVDADGKIKSSDALLVLQHSVALIQLSDDKIIRADVTGDKRINSADALEILQYSVGLITEFK